MGGDGLVAGCPRHGWGSAEGQDAPATELMAWRLEAAAKDYKMAWWQDATATGLGILPLSRFDL